MCAGFERIARPSKVLSPLRLGAVLQVRAGFGHLPFLVPQLSARISIQALEILRERLTFPSIDAPSSSRILFASVCHIANQRWQAIVFTPLHYRLFSAHCIISLPATSSASRVVFPSRGDQLLRVAPLLCYFNEVKCIIKEWNPSVVMTVLEPSEWPLLSAAESPHWGGVAAETLLTIAADPKHLGARIGVTAVLHTWGSALTHHPRVHCIVPGGGVSLDGERWAACRPGFFLPVRVLSRLFRRRLLEQLVDAHHTGDLNFFGRHQGLTDAIAFD